MSIENPTLVHFRHFSSLFTNLPSTSVESALQIDPFMQNKANFQKSQMNVNPYNTTDYENKSDWTLGENKPNTKPIKANFRKSQNECKLTYNKGLQKKRRFRSPKKQTQSNPIPQRDTQYAIRDTRYKPNQTQFQRQKNAQALIFLTFSRRALCI